MKSLAAKELKISPHFDLETFMLLSETRRIDGMMAMRMEESWKRLFPHLKAYRLGDKKGYLVIFMEPAVEEIVDSLWEKSPSQGFELQTLAQSMIMAAMQELMPDVQSQGCAPVPEPNKILKKSLKPLGLEFQNTGTLNVKYGVLTKFPYSAGCEACYLKESCPKMSMSSVTSRTLDPKAGD